MNDAADLELAKNPDHVCGEILAVIPNILYRQDLNYVAAGDLFLGRTGATYIGYIAGISPAPIVSGAAALLGGVTGLLAVSGANVLSDKKGFLARCEKPRLIEWGLPVNERIAKKGRFKVDIPRHDITSVETEDGIAVKGGGKSWVFGYGDELNSYGAAALFSSWAGAEIGEHSSLAEFGLHRKFELLPQELVIALLNGQTLSTKYLTEVSGDSAFMTSFLEGLASVNSANLPRILDHILTAPEVFRLHVVSFLEDRAVGGDSPPPSIYAWAAVSILFVILTATILDKVPLVFIGLIVCVGGFLATLADWLRGPRRYFKEIRRLQAIK